MNDRRRRALGAAILLLGAYALGYSSADTLALETPVIPAATVAAPLPGTTRIVYSLTEKQNDKELIALIDAATTRIYFAIYTFTSTDIAEALARAKARGVEVRGVVDSGQIHESFSAKVLDTLTKAGISLVAEKHPSGTGIMHIKALVTDSAYATGSYNWTKSATTVNDEVLEIGTDPTLRAAYERLLLQLLDAYKDNPAAANAAAPVSIGSIPYTEASEHIGETASVTGTLVKAYTARSGVTFLDFCSDYKSCPFTAVIFADDLPKFKNLQSYVGSPVTLTGKITSYNGKAEIILNDASQLKR